MTNQNRRANIVLAAIRSGYRVITEVQVSSHIGTVDLLLTEKQVEKYVDFLITTSENDTIAAEIDNFSKTVII